ncbi:MAG: hypothetical protein IKJ47_01665 [Oscillospiraceae bacterium]|nr:hypothetical protein [Oscillospiraceae bacterium]
MAEYLSKKKNSNTSADDLADDMTKTARKSRQNVIDSVEKQLINISPDGSIVVKILDDCGNIVK